MDQTAPAQPLAGSASLNGLAEPVAAAAAARERLGRDLDILSREVRAQMGATMEKTAWKVAATGGAVLVSVVVRKMLMSGWRKARKSDPPTNPAARDIQWSEALAWTVATSIVIGIARLVAQRGIAGAWEKTVGSKPPGLQDISP